MIPVIIYVIVTVCHEHSQIHIKMSALQPGLRFNSHRRSNKPAHNPTWYIWCTCLCSCLCSCLLYVHMELFVRCISSNTLPRHAVSRENNHRQGWVMKTNLQLLSQSWLFSHNGTFCCCFVLLTLRQIFHNFFNNRRTSRHTFYPFIVAYFTAGESKKHYAW